MKITKNTKCVECGRVFNLMNTEDSHEYFYGHDCEAI